MESIVAVRTATVDELETFADFWMAMFEEVGNLSRADFPADWRERLKEYLRRRIGDGEAAVFVAVDREGKIVASAAGIVQDGYPFAVHGIKRGYIFGVRTEPEFRGGGLAPRVTSACIEFLTRAGCKRIRLHASKFGRVVYDRLGFLPTNEMELRVEI